MNAKFNCINCEHKIEVQGYTIEKCINCIIRCPACSKAILVLEEKGKTLFKDYNKILRGK